MSFLDKFLNAVRLNDDYDDDDEFFDEEDDVALEPLPEEDKEELKSSRFFKKLKEEEEEKPPVASHKAPKSEAKQPKLRGSKVTPMRRQSTARNDMEVSVIRPTTMENTREIADTLLSNCTVVLNLEGIDVELAQRIIDFTCGTCYAIDGSLQKISNFIFILTPANVEISGDIQDVLNGGIPAIRSEY